MNLPVIDLDLLTRFQLVYLAYEAAHHKATFAEDLCDVARPVMLHLAYDGPDVSDLFVHRDRIDVALRGSDVGAITASHLRAARREASREIAETIARILRRARNVAEQQIDEAIVAEQRGSVTSLETKLAASVEHTRPKVGELPLRTGKEA